ncbi:MAG: urease subunit alpha [Pseudonocardiales bacterium]|uniref:urease subunit alpha n=1 Tax=Pseudonocardia sp. TaxID=60912 RepID=UPI0026347B2F|nr:urease subunit alpha [Pseudonocardia sp.]MCW2720170.1 urease alpha subunit [Pseudonocardia sp.]MDT7616037.1 urease subunit alpha [Pseudonocardiales bacterium]MDT7704482.1 urease subunit alpha [Pseudonocardiales bacterium]
MPRPIERPTYNTLYGPTVGDRIQLADTNLVAEVEADHTSYGDEPLWGFGKTIRDSMGMSSHRDQDSTMDLIIANVVVVDPLVGIVKTNIGIKEGRIVGLGRAGNPDVTDGVDLVAGANTGWIMGEGMIATAGIIDPHVHLATTSLIPAALSAGTTTVVGMGYGHVSDLGVNPEYHFHRLMEAWEGYPMNVALLGRGSSSDPDPLERNMEMGAAGLKIHEDSASFTSVIDNALTIADEYDVPVCIHTDSNQEGGELEDTLAAIDGRTIHAYHIEGLGGGHPNVLELAGVPHVLGSSTTPTIPYSVNTYAEYPEMKMAVHRMHASLEEDRASLNWRGRGGTVAGESVLHDRGAIAMMSSDSQGMGRIGEVSIRTWQLAHRMKEAFGAEGPNDNARILRYLAKLTVNPAITQGMAHEIGSLRSGLLADIVLWRPEFFGVKPQLVLKNGFVVWGPVGGGNDSTRLGQPQIYRPMFGSYGLAPASLGVAFVGQAAIDSGLAGRLKIRRRLSAVQNSRHLTKADLVLNGASPQVRVSPDSLEVEIDGRPVDLPPAEVLPMTNRYFL